MDDIDPRIMEVFYDVQSGLPRQGPGDRSSTLRALGLCSELPADPTVLDIGCGPGMQTMALAEASSGHITAVDTCDAYLDQLRQRVEDADLRSRVEVHRADMMNLSVPAASLDLIWCEGAAYIMGISAALRAWRTFLSDGGYLAFTELVWLTDSPPERVAEFFRAEYPAMTNRGALEEQILDEGYELIGDFTLPDSAWWDDYYTPLQSKLPSLQQKYSGDEAALAIVSATETEINMRREFGSEYGYQFFICKKVS